MNNPYFLLAETFCIGYDYGMETRVFKYLESDSALHNLRDYKGRKLSVKELAHMCGVEEVVIYANLKDPESPKEKLEEFLRI